MGLPRWGPHLLRKPCSLSMPLAPSRAASAPIAEPILSVTPSTLLHQSIPSNPGMAYAAAPQVITGGVKDLFVLKTTQSGYAGFGRCAITTLPGAFRSSLRRIA